jgi:hypothetical protein
MELGKRYHNEMPPLEPETLHVRLKLKQDKH